LKKPTAEGRSRQIISRPAGFPGRKKSARSGAQRAPLIKITRERRAQQKPMARQKRIFRAADP
jgi:hypothetical protein